jgi:tRNA(Ile)-lysidine synthase
MKYVVAVSGGVDSVVLLDMLARSGEHELIVAHFDHGIRQESADDAGFAALLAEKYGLSFESVRVELGAKASEDTARQARYNFLRRMAAKHEAVLVTAHHQDDAVETIAINLVRGTGWRGLAAMNDKTIHRPLVNHSKQQLYQYAVNNGLEWVEDVTNTTDAYLRNRLRKRLNRLSADTKSELISLWGEQSRLASEIDAEAAKLATTSRYKLTMIDEACALELLRATLAGQSLSLDRPRRRRLLHAIKTARPGSTFEPGSHVTVRFTMREFIVKHPL